MNDDLDIEIERGDDVTFTITVYNDIPKYKEIELRNLAKKQSLSLNDYIEKNFTALIADGTITVYDITSCTLKFSVRRGYRTDLLFQLTSTDGDIVLTDPTNGEAEITIADTDTVDFLNSDSDYVYDVEITKPTGKIETVVRGKLRVLADVTYT